MSRLSNLQAEVVQLVVAGAPVMLYTNKICKQHYIHHATCPTVSHLQGKGRNIFLTFFFWRDIGGAVEEQWRNSGEAVEQKVVVLYFTRQRNTNTKPCCLLSTIYLFYFLLSTIYRLYFCLKKCLVTFKVSRKMFSFLIYTL